MKRYEYESALYESQLHPAAKQVGAYLAYRKNWKKDGKVFPSIATVVRDTGLSRSTVNRRLRELRELGWLVPTGATKGRGVRAYDLHIGRSDTPEAQIGLVEGQTEASDGSARHTEQVSEQVIEQASEEVSSVASAPALISQRGSDLGSSFAVTVTAQRPVGGCEVRRPPEALSEPAAEDPEPPVRTGSYWRELRKRRPLTRAEQEEVNASSRRFLASRREQEQQSHSGDAW